MPEKVIVSEGPPSRDELLATLPGTVVALLTTATEKVDAGVLGAAGRRLRIVANMAIGYDNVDVGRPPPNAA